MEAHGPLIPGSRNEGRSTSFASLVAVLGLAPTLALAAIINVPADQPTIQGGINAANPGDTVIVASGVYDEQIVIDKNNLKLKGNNTTIKPSTVVWGRGDVSRLLRLRR